MTPRGKDRPNVIKQSNCETGGLKSKYWIWQLYSAILIAMQSTIKLDLTWWNKEKSTNCQTTQTATPCTAQMPFIDRENKTKRRFSCHNCPILLSRDCKMTSLYQWNASNTVNALKSDRSCAPLQWSLLLKKTTTKNGHWV